jgi:nitric oxide reductase NorD protein
MFRYPEYNFNKKGYEENHCVLFESTLPPAPQSGFYESVMTAHKVVYKRIRKRFLLMKPDETGYERRMYSGDEIHTGDALDYAIGLKRGESPDEKIYMRKVKNTRDIAVAILVDASSSTDLSVNGKRIIDIEKEALSLLAGALSLIEDPFGIYGFYSMGRQRVMMNILKGFDEKWDGITQNRIDSLAPYAANRDGCAIRHVKARLAERAEKTRLLILLSDGIPADHQYGATGSADTSPYAIEDTRRAIQECRQENIVPYCITIDRQAKKYISRLYGDYHYAVLSDVTKLPEKLSQLYFRLTR